MGHATNKNITQIGASSIKMHTILKPNMIGVEHATKNNGIIGW